MVSFMATQTPRERRQQRTRQEILTTALEIIVEKGPDKLSLREIARRVDYSPAGLYEYFGSKDEIIDAVCEEGDRRLHNMLQSVPESLSVVEYLVQLGLAYVQFAIENTAHFMLVFTQLSPSGASKPIESFEPDPTYGIVYAAVQRGVEEGVLLLREGQTLHDVAVGLWSVGHGLAMLRVTKLRSVEFDFARADRETLKALIRGLGQDDS